MIVGGMMTSAGMSGAPLLKRTPPHHLGAPLGISPNGLDLLGLTTRKGRTALLIRKPAELNFGWHLRDVQPPAACHVVGKLGFVAKPFAIGSVYRKPLMKSSLLVEGAGPHSDQVDETGRACGNRLPSGDRVYRTADFDLARRRFQQVDERGSHDATRSSSGLARGRLRAASFTRSFRAGPRGGDPFSQFETVL